MLGAVAGLHSRTDYCRSYPYPPVCLRHPQALTVQESAFPFHALPDLAGMPRLRTVSLDVDDWWVGCCIRVAVSCHSYECMADT